eukprot:TRINITY_DN773167_c0_g1_i1.p1 TRINITY_DN773167_c0_g1~~TRINITY_DN773167_c0_g1_i1.p1  ORF type:complete len:185 (-),score=49.35 TRINITY_DN773167_c0_g1_i1:220-711(-)
MRIITLFLVLVVLVLVSAKKEKDPNHCEVCLKVIGAIDETITKEERKDLETVENAVEKFCSKKHNAKIDKACYYLLPIKRDVARPFTLGAPVERICKKLAKKNPELCLIKFQDVKASEAMKPEKMRIRQLRAFLSERGLTCDGCWEKSDYVRKVKEVIAAEGL